jgi:dTMP kinase
MDSPNRVATPSHRSKRGFFLALDGPDGGGKTTQVANLVAWLGEKGCDVVACRDPGGTALGDRIRGLLLDHDEHVALGLRAEMLLYMASRAQLVDERIAPALEAGKLVVCDRFLLANVVYQGHAGGLDVDDVWRVGGVATGGLMPDLTLVLDVIPEVATARLQGPRDRMEARGADFHRRVRSGFLRALKTYPAPFRLIDASVEPELVAQKIRTEVAHALGIRSGA